MKSFLTLCAVFAAGFATASVAASFPKPENCRPMVTVQRNSCAVSTIMDCGSNRLMLTHVGGRLADTHVFGPQWDIEGYAADNSAARFLAADGTAPEVSLGQLLETGSSVGTRPFLFNTRIVKDREILLESEMTLSGDEVALGGQSFRAGKVTRTFVVNPKVGGMTVEFDILMAKDGSLMIEGAMRRDNLGRIDEIDMTPRAIAWPGEAGFATTEAQFGCGG